MEFLTEVQVFYKLCYRCYLFKLFVKWILENFYKLQSRKTLMTNRRVESSEKSKERKFREES